MINAPIWKGKKISLMATLQRYDGTSVAYADSDLDSLIAHRIAGNASGTGNGDNVYFMCAPTSLLIMDLNWQINRRFSELFQASANMNQLFYLQFENDHDYYNLPEALVKCGYAGVLPQDAAIFRACTWRSTRVVSWAPTRRSTSDPETL